MSVALYPEYKDSGVEWIGKLPTHWRVFSLKYLVSMQSGDAITSEQIEEVGEFPVFGGNGLRGYTGAHTHQGDFVLIGRQGALCGNINYARGQFWASEHAVVVSPRFSCAVTWLGELLRCMNLGQYSVSAAQPGLSVEALGNLRIPVPPPEEQSAIAAFLDQETSKIDALVAEQERLIALLKEKRQAVISQAVTKGLNPNAPMKDSGIEWLGQVPAHWKGIALKHACTLIKDGTHLPPPRVAEGIPLLSVRNLIDGRFTLRDDDSQISRADYEELARSFVVAPDDILLAIVGATLGKSALVESGLGEFHIQRSVAAFRTKKSLLEPAFLHLIFNTDGFQKLLWQHVGFSAQPGIYLGALQNFCIALPQLKEQKEIIDAVSGQMGVFESLITEATQAITLLRERRAALISAAVTGKIDVRAFIPTTQEAA